MAHPRTSFNPGEGSPPSPLPPAPPRAPRGSSDALMRSLVCARKAPEAAHRSAIRFHRHTSARWFCRAPYRALFGVSPSTLWCLVFHHESRETPPPSTCTARSVPVHSPFVLRTATGHPTPDGRRSESAGDPPHSLDSQIRSSTFRANTLRSHPLSSALHSREG